MKYVVYLVDASPYIFRAFHSLPSSIRDDQGRQVNAVYGFAGFLLRLLASERPRHLAVCFDGSLTTSFRNELFPEYKAHREAPPPELEAQVADCRRMAEALGAATCVDARYEADDLVATLATKALERGWDAVVVTSDKDLTQLVSDRVTLFDAAREARLGPAEVETRLGVRAQQVPDYLGLAGDSVDNIPGVRGVGAKTAVALLRQFSSLEEILAHPNEVAELPIRGARALGERLLAQRDLALLSKRLATVVRDVPLDLEAEDLALSPVDLHAVDTICRRLGFRTLPGRIRRRLGVEN